MLKALPCILLLLCTLSFLPPASGLLITDPENVTYMAATVTQSGRLKLNSMDAEIDVLTKEQKKYLSSWDVGT